MPILAEEKARLTAELTTVRAAILKAYEKQSYSEGETGLSVSRADLDKLTAREKELELKLAALEAREAAAPVGRGRIRMFYGVPRG